jgi:hypothetical protein
MRLKVATDRSLNCPVNCLKVLADGHPVSTRIYQHTGICITTIKNYMTLKEINNTYKYLYELTQKSVALVFQHRFTLLKNA